MTAARKSTPLLHRALELSRGAHSLQISQDIVLLLLQAGCDGYIWQSENIDLFNSVVGHDIDIFEEKLLLLSEDARSYGKDAMQLVCEEGFILSVAVCIL